MPDLMILKMFLLKFFKSIFVYLLKTSLILYFFYFISAFITGEFIYKKIKNKKLNFFMRSELINSYESHFPYKNILYKNHNNLIFFFIYSRINKKLSFFTFFNRYFIYKFIFWYFTGISWLFFSFVKKLFKNKTISFEKFLLIELENNDNSKLIYAKGGIWKTNSNKDYILKILKTYGEFKNFNPKAIKILEEDFIHLYDNSLKKMNALNCTPLKTQWSVLKNNPKAGAHLTVDSFHKDKMFTSWLTDYNKAVNNDFYDKEKLVERFNFKKPTTIVAENIDNLKQYSTGKLISQKLIIKGGVESGYNKKLITDEVLENFITIDEGFKAIDTFAVTHDIDQSTIKAMKEVFIFDTQLYITQEHDVK